MSPQGKQELQKCSFSNNEKIWRDVQGGVIRNAQVHACGTARIGTWKTGFAKMSTLIQPKGLAHSTRAIY
jgi:hypothetical protein